MKRYGIETVPHLICGGLSCYDIEDALIDMDFLGIENVLALGGIKGVTYVSYSDDATYHPGRCARVYAGETYLGVMGQIHPAFRRGFMGFGFFEPLVNGRGFFFHIVYLFYVQPPAERNRRKNRL